MATNTLDQWTSTPQEKKSGIISDEHALHLYEQSFQRELDKLYDAQIENFLEKERAEKKAHKEYTDKNYVRIGGN